MNQLYTANNVHLSIYIKKYKYINVSEEYFYTRNEKMHHAKRKTNKEMANYKSKVITMFKYLNELFELFFLLFFFLFYKTEKEKKNTFKKKNL